MRTTTGKITIRNGEVVKRERDDVSEVVLAGDAAQLPRCKNGPNASTRVLEPLGDHINWNPFKLRTERQYYLAAQKWVNPP